MVKLGFKHLNLRAKMLIIAVISALGVIASLSIFYSVTTENNKKLLAVKSHYFPILQEINTVISSMPELERMARGLLQDTDLLQEVEDLAAASTSRLKKILALDPKQAKSTNEFISKLQRYVEQSSELADEIDDGEISDQEILTKVQQNQFFLTQLTDNLNLFKQRNSDIVARYVSESLEGSERALFLGVTVGGVTMMATVFFAFFISGLITTNVNNIISTLNGITSGDADLTQRLQSNSQDEIGQLVDIFNAFLEKLQLIISKVQYTTTVMQEFTSEMVNNSNESYAATEKQGKDIHIAASAISEMTEKVWEISEHAETTAGETEKAAGESSRSTQIVRQNKIEMELLATSIQSVSNVIQELAETSKSINSVIGVIEGISNQTNLLALNAAIEAARAGEQGRGFSVVADEVRSLSQRTQDSTQDIKVQIDQLQDTVQKTVTEMTEGTNKAQQNMKSAADAEQALISISETVDMINKMNQQVSDIASTQANTALSVNKNIVKVAHSVEDTSQVSQTIINSSLKLKQIANDLQSYTGQFKV